VGPLKVADSLERKTMVGVFLASLISSLFVETLLGNVSACGVCALGSLSGVAET
jgi:hypothetical protein